MIYCSYPKRELSQLGILENELAIYIGTTDPCDSNIFVPGINNSDIRVYVWQNGQSQEPNVHIYHGRFGLCVLKVKIEEEEYTFFWSKLRSYICQESGPERPIAAVNLGAIPLRIDTFLGKFMVYAGSALQLDENTPQREKKKVLFTINSHCKTWLTSAKVWNGAFWKRLNIREGDFSVDGSCCLTVLDGNSAVQCLEINERKELFIPDFPELGSDYESYVFVESNDSVTLCFDRTDGQCDQAVQRSRTIPPAILDETIIYDLQKLHESLSESEVFQCTAELPVTSDILKSAGLNDGNVFSSRLKEIRKEWYLESYRNRHNVPTPEVL